MPATPRLLRCEPISAVLEFLKPITQIRDSKRIWILIGGVTVVTRERLHMGRYRGRGSRVSGPRDWRERVSAESYSVFDRRAMALGARGLWRWAPEGYGGEF